MEYSFKKGQIVPKKLGMKFVNVHKAARHNIRFGCDAVANVEGDVLKVQVLSEGAVFDVSRVSRRRNNGTRQRCAVRFENVYLTGFGYESVGMKVTA